MKDLSPVVDHDDVMDLLGRHFSAPIHDLERVEGGQVARTFSFGAGSEAFILRFNVQLGANFEKEAFIARLLGASGIPIPPLLHHGRLGELHYAISRKAPGVPVSQLDRADVESLTPAMVEILDAIHAVDVSGTAGYAVAGNDGNGLFPGWKQSLAVIREEESEWDFFGKWHTLFETSFLERHVFDRIYGHMERVLPLCPEDRRLIHGNIGYGNLLAQDGKITAVLDWQEAGYGDHLYDVAQLDFWDAEGRWADRFHDHYRDQGFAVPHYTERIRCYQLYTGLNALRFFAKQGNEDAYRWTRNRLSDAEQFHDPGSES
jgi:hygromycin-B 4-O-kinase